MLECGYRTTEEKQDDLPPAGWDAMVSSVTYIHRIFQNFTCTLVLVTMGDVKQAMISFPKQDIEIVTKISIIEYVVENEKNTYDEHSFKNLPKLAQKLRNELLVPLQIAAHRILGLESPFHLNGLPTELLLLIFKKLDFKTALKLSLCSKRLNEVVKDESIWEYYCKRDFNISVSVFNSNTRWFDQYKELFKNESEKVGWSRPFVQDPNFHIPGPRIYPTGPTFPGGQPFPGPTGPYPTVPNPAPPFNPFIDPDSPYFSGEIPNQPPNPLQPRLPFHGGPGSAGPFGADPTDPFGDPQFGGLGPALPGRRPNRGGFGGGPGGFRYI